MSVLYGPDGRVVSTRDLREEFAAPSLTGIRRAWNSQALAPNLTPERLARVLKDAALGEIEAYLTLAEEMEEREPHYGSVLGTRKRAVSGLEPVVEAASDKALDQKLADEVRGLIATPEFDGLLEDCLDALGKGFSAVEVMWGRGKTWVPRAYEYRDPRWFRFDQEDGRTLRLLDQKDLNGAPLPPFKFVTHLPRLKSGLPIRGGLARIAATPFMAKSYTLTDWLAFAEIFGLPVRIGRYGPAATKEDIETLIGAVANLGTDAAAVLPDSMRIEFQQAGSGQGGDRLFLALAEWLDRQTSKAVLGQTMTTDDGSSQAQAKVHDEVRADILKADAKQLAATLNRDLVRPFIDLNFGRQEVYPRLVLPVEEPEDVKAMSEALGKLVPLGGLGIQASVVRDKLGFPDPEDGAVLLGDKGATRESPALNRAGALGTGVGLNGAGAPFDPTYEELAELEDWEEVLEPVTRAVEESEGPEDLAARLAELELETAEVRRRLAEACFKARGEGNADE